MVEYVFDTFAWIERLTGGRFAEAVEVVHVTRDVGTPDVVLAEIAHFYERRPHPNRDAAIAAVTSTSTPLPTTPEIALAAGVTRSRLEGQRRGIGLVACIVLETARAHGATLLTGDPHLKGLKGVEFLG